MRPLGAPDPDTDLREGFLLSYARMLDDQVDALAGGRAALLITWSLPHGADEASRRLELTQALSATGAYRVFAVDPDDELGRIKAVALMVGDDERRLLVALDEITAAHRSALDQPGSRLRPPAISRSPR